MACADVSGLLQPVGLTGEHLFDNAAPIERALHISAPQVLRLPDLARVLVELTVQQPGTRPAGTELEWGISGAAGFQRLVVESDSTQGLVRSGVVVLQAPTKWLPSMIDGVESLWLTCRVAAAATADGGAFVSPRIGALRVGAHVRAQPQAATALCWGSLLLDASKDFFPFGERPRFGELFHVMAPALAVPNARLVLDVRLTNPAGQSQSPLPAVDRKGQPRVQWEAFTGRGWVALDATDATQAFTRHGEVAFVLPANIEQFVLAGQRGAWVRARLVSGHYGAPQLVDGLLFPAAPAIATLELHSALDITPATPMQLLRSGVLESVTLDAATASFEPFPKPTHDGPAVYVALDPQEPLHAGRELTFQVEPGASTRRPVWRDGMPDSTAPRWQQRSADGWRDCAVADDSNGMTRPGIVCVRLAAEPTRWPGSTVPAAAAPYWLRIVWPADAAIPHLRRLVLNTVMARQTIRLENEILGSSNGRPNQAFNTLRMPIVGDVLLQVREADAWIEWQAVATFAGSDAQSRHFQLDHHSGKLRFGDGRRGCLPPAGANNIRLREYHVGGGRRGNVAAGAANQLRTTVPYVQAVTHHEPAAGGQDAGDADATLRAASAWLRHRDRAICDDDYASLCLAAAPEVARAWCFSCRDLDAGTAARAAGFAPGAVSVLVLTHGAQARPQPSADLLRRIRAFLDARRPLNTELVLLGPDYVPCAVSTRVATRPGRSAHEVSAVCRRRLCEFLHPVTGGELHEGWAPGARPHRSDLLAVIGAVEGVEHVLDLRWSVDESAIDYPRRALALVCAGALAVNV
jgi:predicted phage baseplate assembly protein